MKVHQFFGQWLPLGTHDVTNIGRQNTILGVNAIAGSKVWDQQSKIRVVFGPLTFTQFLGFLPNGSAHAAARSIIRFFTGIELDFDLRLSLVGREVPGCVLTTRAARRPMLGWTSFLKTIPVSGIDDQVVLGTDN